MILMDMVHSKWPSFDDVLSQVLNWEGLNQFSLLVFVEILRF